MATLSSLAHLVPQYLQSRGHRHRTVAQRNHCDLFYFGGVITELIFPFFETKKWKWKVKSLSRVWHFLTPWTVAYQAPPSLGFSRQEYWSGVPFPSPGNNPNSGIEPGSPTLQADTLTPEPLGKSRGLQKPGAGETACKEATARSQLALRPWAQCLAPFSSVLFGQRCDPSSRAGATLELLGDWHSWRLSVEGGFLDFYNTREKSAKCSNVPADILHKW